MRGRSWGRVLDKSVYSRGKKIASIDGLSDFGMTIMSAGVAKQKVNGQDERYLWVVVAPTSLDDLRIISCRTTLRKKMKLVPDPDNPGETKESTDWTIIGSHNVGTDPAFMLDGLYDGGVRFIGRNANESSSEAAIVYCSQKANGPSGYIKVRRSQFSVEVIKNNRNVNLPYSKNETITDTSFQQTISESSAPLSSEGFVFDVGYRGDELAEAKITINNYTTTSNINNVMYSSNDGREQESACVGAPHDSLIIACCYLWGPAPHIYSLRTSDQSGQTSCETIFSCNGITFPLLKIEHRYNSLAEYGEEIIIQEGVDGCEISLNGLSNNKNNTDLMSSLSFGKYLIS